MQAGGRHPSACVHVFLALACTEGRKEGRKEGREEGTKEGRKGGRKGGRKEGRKEVREGGKERKQACTYIHEGRVLVWQASMEG